MATINRPYCIDIYHSDTGRAGNDPDFARVKAFGIVGVIHKSSQGSNSFDGTYTRRRKLALAQGLLWGAYHFMDLSDPVAQAKHFLNVSEPDKDTLVALDWENVSGSSPTAAQAHAFLDVIEEMLSRKAVIYSGNVAKERLPHDEKGNGIPDPYFGAHKLWLAQYGNTWHVHPSWERPWLWQNNGDNSGPGPHQIPGIVGNCDNNTIVDPMTELDLVAQWAS